MKYFASMMIFLSCVVFDCAVIGSTGWLILERQWSGWWFCLAIFICCCANPMKAIKMVLAA